MTSKISIAMIIGLATVGLASCDNQTRPGTTTPPGIDVEITVTGSVEGAVTITVEPYLLDLSSRPGEQPIKFWLNSTNFSYVTDKNQAIEIKGDPNHLQFSDNKRGRMGKMMTVTDKNTGGETYQYILRVEDSSGNKLELDPLIKNGN